jgi:hypothetical protein
MVIYYYLSIKFVKLDNNDNLDLYFISLKIFIFSLPYLIVILLRTSLAYFTLQLIQSYIFIIYILKLKILIITNIQLNYIYYI